jgi:hypothetical protein
MQRWGWWGVWDISWVVTTHIGAQQLKSNIPWSKPLFEAYIAGCWMLLWTEDTLYWVAKPTVHTELIENRKRLHSADGPTLESDIENLYFWHGVFVPAFVVLNPEWITIEHIETEENAEVRRVMIERYGQARYLQDSSAEKIHEDDWGTLYRKEVPGDEPLVMVKVVNSTPEPDGSFHDYFLRVDPTITTARQAVAWTFGKETAEYDPFLQT